MGLIIITEQGTTPDTPAAGKVGIYPEPTAFLKVSMTLEPSPSTVLAEADLRTGNNALHQAGPSPFLPA